MKELETKTAACISFEANGRTVILRHARAPYQDEETGLWHFVGYRFQWYRNDFSTKPVRLSAKSFKYVQWTY